MLPGITDVVSNWRRSRLAVCGARRARSPVRAADELWLHVIDQEVLPIVSLDGRPVSDGQPGRRMRDVCLVPGIRQTVMRGG